MMTLRSLATAAVIATSLCLMSGHASADTDEQVYIDKGSTKIKFLDGSLSWQVSILHVDTSVVTNNIEIDLIDRDGFVIETLRATCMESKPLSLTLFRGLNRFYSDLSGIRTLKVKTKSMGKSFCDGFGVDRGELQLEDMDLLEWMKTAAISEYLTLTVSLRKK